MREVKEHINESCCWCSPVCIFNAGDSYGRVYVHKNMNNESEDPGREIMMVAIFRALYDLTDAHIKDCPADEDFKELFYDNDNK